MAISTFKSFKGRTIQTGVRVLAYRNLRNGKWSLKCADTGLVLGHAEAVELEECELVVSESGRQRVLAEKQKNIHAGILGRYVDSIVRPKEEFPNGIVEITYNPYKYDSFVKVDGEIPVKQALGVYMDNSTKVYGTGDIK